MKNFSIICAAVAMVSAPAFANKDHDKGNMEQKTQFFFEKMDSDGNGMVSKAESDAFGAKMFNEADTNKDQFLSLAEVKAHKMKKKEEYKLHQHNMSDDDKETD